MITNIDGKSALEWFNQGIELKKAGNYYKAIDCFENVVKIDPANKATWKLLGDLYEQIGNYQKTIECYDKSDQL